MRIFLREMRAHYKGLIGWSIGMILLIISGMIKFTTISSGGQTATELFKSFPKSFLTIFGINGLDLATVIGFFGVMYLYVVLLATIHAAMLGAEIISKEERDRTSEFLFTKPIARHKILSQKIAAGIFNIVILNIVTLVTSIFTVAYYAHGWSNNRMVLILTTAVLLMQFLFFSLGVALAGLFKNPRLPSIVATVVLLATYIMWVVIDLNKTLDFLKYFTPFKYFDASKIIAAGHLDNIYVIVTFAVSLALIGVTYYTFSKRDLKL